MLTRIATGILLACCLATTLATALGLIAGRVTSVIALVSLSLGILVAALLTWKMFLHEEKILPTFWNVAAWSAFGVFLFHGFLWLIYIDGDAWMAGARYNLGDLPLHITFIQTIANGSAFWMENPIFADTPLRYPLGMDLFNGLLALIGVDILRGLIWVGLLGGICLGVALQRWGGAFAMAGFLFAGGLAGWAIFKTGALMDYQLDAEWKSLPLALLLTQRGLLYALPVGLLLLVSLRSRLEGEGMRLPTGIEWIFYATMPLFHVHTFLFLSATYAIAFILSPKSRRSLLLLVGLSILPATAILSLVAGFESGSKIGFQPGWMQGEANPLWFWIFNFGLFLPLAIAAIVLAIRGKSPTLAITVAAAVVFLACTQIRFAPWPWDNTKLMIWAYLALLPAIWQLVLRPLHPALQTTVCIGLFFSGAVSLAGGLGPGRLPVNLATRSEIANVQSLVADLPIDTKFIAAPTYNHPLLLLGRPIVMGYDGHLWSHGVDYGKRAEAVELVMRGSPLWPPAARSLNADYLFFGRHERERYGDGIALWKIPQREVRRNPGGKLYHLSFDE